MSREGDSWVLRAVPLALSCAWVQVHVCDCVLPMGALPYCCLVC